MTSTLRVNRRTTANRRLMLRSAATSVVLLCASYVVVAQEQIRTPLQPLTIDLKSPGQDKVQPPNTDPKNQFALEDEGKYTPPSKEELYRMDSEASLAERARQLRKSLGRTEVEFPDYANMRITTSMPPRTFQPMTATKQPSYVVFQPLYFQQINHERYGWELGVFQPVVSTAQFYGDVLLFPYKFAANPPWACETNAGYALPGDPEPLRFLTTPFSWRGVIGEAGVAIGGAAIFP